MQKNQHHCNHRSEQWHHYGRLLVALIGASVLVSLVNLVAFHCSTIITRGRFFKISKRQWPLRMRGGGSPIWSDRLFLLIQNIINLFYLIAAVVDVSSRLEMSPAAEKVIMGTASKYSISLIFDNFQTHFLKHPVYWYPLLEVGHVCFVVETTVLIVAKFLENYILLFTLLYAKFSIHRTGLQSYLLHLLHSKHIWKGLIAFILLEWFSPFRKL